MTTASAFDARRVSTSLARLLVLYSLAFVLATVPLAAAPLPHNIPDFGTDPSRTTVRSVQSGSWSSASTWSSGVVPTANQVVHVDPGHVVTIGDTAAVAYTVAVHGTLRFNPAVNTRLKVTNLMVMGDHGMPGMTTNGYLEIGTAATPIAPTVTAELVIANTAIGGGVADPEQFGTGLLNFGKLTMHGTPMTPTWTRVSVEPRAGHTTLTLVGRGDRMARGRPHRPPGYPAPQFQRDRRLGQSAEPVGRADDPGGVGRRAHPDADRGAAVRPPGRARLQTTCSSSCRTSAT